MLLQDTSGRRRCKQEQQDGIRYPQIAAAARIYQHEIAAVAISMMLHAWTHNQAFSQWEAEQHDSKAAGHLQVHDTAPFSHGMHAW